MILADRSHGYLAADCLHRSQEEILNAWRGGRAEICARLLGRQVEHNGYLLALKVKTTSSTVCAGPGTYFHRITACEAYSDSMGLPPLVDLRHVSIGLNGCFQAHLPFEMTVAQDERILGSGIY